MCPFSVAGAAKASGNYATCNIGGLCGGDMLTVGVCSATGGSFEGGRSVCGNVIVTDK